MRTVMIAVVTLLPLASLANAQIKVIKSAGVEKGKSETNIVFKAADGGKGVPIYEILSQSSMMGSGSITGAGGTASIQMGGTGVNTRLICEAPAELVVDGGVYQFQIITNPILNGYFKISATGGKQVWLVKKGWGAAAIPFIMSGLVTSIVGSGLLITGAATGMEEIAIGGGIFTLYGAIALPIGLTNKPSSKRIE